MIEGLTLTQTHVCADALIEYGMKNVRTPLCAAAIDALHAIGYPESADALTRYRDSLRELYGDESDVVRRISDYSVKA